MGLYKNIKNNESYKYNIGLKLSNFNTKQILYFDDNYVLSSLNSNEVYHIKYEYIKRSSIYLSLMPVNINIGMLKNHLYFNYSLNINLNIYSYNSNVKKDNNYNDLIISKWSDVFPFSFNSGIISNVFTLMQHDIGFVFYPKYLKKYNISISPNYGFYFTLEPLYNNNLLSKQYFIYYKIFHFDIIWHLK